MSFQVSPAASEEISTFVANRIGFIELERPKSLNAISLKMIRAMQLALDAWRDDANILAVVVRSQHARAFCAGGDVRFLYEASMRGDVAEREAFFTEEYRLNHDLFTFPKPYIALMNGVVMGGGMGIAQPAHRTGGVRVVTGSTKMAMPETRIGLFPDVGAAWFLARTPGAIGRYLAVTGKTIGAADALYAGLADVYISDDALPRLVETLRSKHFERGADVVTCVMQEAAKSEDTPAVEASTLALERGWIDQHFVLSDMHQILTSLVADRDSTGWAQKIVGVLRECSPLSMAVSLEAVTRADDSMANVLRRDLDITRTTFARGDVIEGIRARIIDKDNTPSWRFRRIEDVTREDVERMFVSAWSDVDHPLRDLRS